MIGGTVDARFVSRPNRFRVLADLRGDSVAAHLPNPGRLRELLEPGARLRLVPVAGANRLTSHVVLAVRRWREWVCLDTRLANAAVADALAMRTLPEFSRYRRHRGEVRWQDVRFDFLLEDPDRCWLEVKSCSLVQGGVARFPDAPTVRGARHLGRLACLALRGNRAAVLFVVVRHAARFAPNDAADVAFGEALRMAAAAGVEVLARRASLQGRRLVLGARVPIDLCRRPLLGPHLAPVSRPEFAPHGARREASRHRGPPR